MSDNEWVQLTPEGDDRFPSCMYLRWPKDRTYRYWLKAGFAEMELTNAEALAFARQLPEVKALVEAVDFAQRTMNDYGNATNWPPDMPMEYATAINKLRDAVVFWKEATDGEGD